MPHLRSTPTPSPSFGLLGGLALAYAATALLCFRLAAPGTNATAVWVPTGLALAAVFRFGPRVWPGIALGAFVANLFQMAPLGLPVLSLLGVALATAAGNTAEALAAGFLVARGSGTQEPFESGSWVLTYIGAAAIASTALGALVGTTAFCTATGHWDAFPTVGLTWWIGDGMGALVVTPLLLTFVRPQIAALPRRTHLEALLAAALLALLWFRICAHPPDRTFILLPLLVLAAVRLGSFYTAALTALLSAMAVGSAVTGGGPFSLEGPASFALLMQQGLLGTLAMTSLALAASVQNRRQIEDDLRNRAIQLAALNALGTSLNAPMDLAARVNAAVDHVAAAVAPDLALISLDEGDPGKQTASARAPGRPRAAPMPDPRVLEACIRNLASREGQAAYLPDLRADTRGPEPSCAEWTSLAALPLRTGGASFGVLGLASLTPRDFQREAVFLETLADQVATGLHNALLHEQLHARAAELEQRVAERTALLREANEDLALAVEHAEAADRAKSAFLAAMSHELRTPLNSVIGFTGVLLGGLLGELSPQQVEPLRIVQRNGRHLLDLINDVLDLSKIEAGEVRFSRQPFDLVQTLREAVEAVAPLAAQKQLALETRFAVETLAWTGDRRRVSQVLLNLLGNAVKFTEQGGVALALALEQEWVRISVQDTGPGIADADLPRLFREFVQLDSGLARRSEGTGLGLALSRRLARLMDGNITVESRLGEGSVFTFTLPLTAPEPAT